MSLGVLRYEIKALLLVSEPGFEFPFATVSKIGHFRSLD